MTQNTNICHLIPVRKAVIKKAKIANDNTDVEKGQWKCKFGVGQFCILSVLF